jgi:hypothetical protein
MVAKTLSAVLTVLCVALWSSADAGHYRARTEENGQVFKNPSGGMVYYGENSQAYSSSHAGYGEDEVDSAYVQC